MTRASTREAPRGPATATPAAAPRSGAKPPSPPGAEPLLGHTRMVLKDALGTFLRAAQEHGDVVSLRLGAQEFWVVSHPRDIERILQTDHDQFIRDKLTKRLLERVYGKTFITTDGAPWLRERKMAQPSFRPDRVRANAPMVAREAQRATEAWRAGEERDIRADLLHMTFRIGGQFLFTSDFAKYEAQVWQGYRKMAAWYGDRVDKNPGGLAFLWSYLSPSYRDSIRDIESIGYGVPEDRAARGSPGQDTFGLILASRDEEGKGLSRAELRNLAVALNKAATDTTASSITFALLALAAHPEAQEKAAAEARAVLQGRQAGDADLAKLKYCDMVAKETLRLYPPTWGIGRETLGPYQVGGYTARKGTNLIVSPYIVHRDARWWPEPERFRPERWAEDMDIPKFAYLPFGGGPHTCMGNVLAQMEIQVTIATVLQRLRLVPVPGKPVDPLGHVILLPRNASLRFEAR